MEYSRGLNLVEDEQPMDWQKLAYCKNAPDPDIFFADSESEQRKVVKQYCRTGCLVMSQCLDYALAIESETVEKSDNATHGVYGGMTEKQRRQLKKQQPRVLSVGLRS